MAQDKEVTLSSGSLKSQLTSDDIESFPTDSDALAVNDVVYIDSAGKAQKAQANSATKEAIGIVIKKVDATNSKVITSGLLESFSSSMTPGARYYLSASAAGVLTTTKPDGANFAQLVGIAASSTSLLVVPTVGGTLTGYSFPLADGSADQVLTTDGSGALSFANQSGGGGGISFDGSTANGVLSYKDSDEATVEPYLTFDGSSLKLMSSADTGDYFTLTVGAAGTMVAATNDDDGTAANLTFDVDGTIYLDSYDFGYVILREGAQEYLRFERRATVGQNDAIIKNMEDGMDIIFQQYDGTETLRLTDDGDVKVAADIYVDKIRRASDSGTTTKILLNDEAIKLYAGDSTNNICTIDSTGLKIDNGSLETATIDYTDGDLSMTIADGGKVTFAAGFAVGSDAAGDILYHNGTSYVRLAKGTADQVLTMNDGATAPGWETASGGGGSSKIYIETFPDWKGLSSGASFSNYPTTNSNKLFTIGSYGFNDIADYIMTSADGSTWSNWDVSSDTHLGQHYFRNQVTGDTGYSSGAYGDDGYFHSKVMNCGHIIPVSGTITKVWFKGLNFSGSEIRLRLWLSTAGIANSADGSSGMLAGSASTGVISFRELNDSGTYWGGIQTGGNSSFDYFQEYESLSSNDYSVTAGQMMIITLDPVGATTNLNTSWSGLHYMIEITAS